MTELITYLNNNRYKLVNDGERHRARLSICTSSAESAVESVIGDRFKKNRKMRWTHKGVNALLHIRVAELNGELADVLERRHWWRAKAANDEYWVKGYDWEAVG